MLNLSRLLEDLPYLGTILSILIGFGIAAMCRPGCKGEACIQYRGPSVKEIDGAVFQYGSKCVEFDASPKECPKKGIVVNTIPYES